MPKIHQIAPLAALLAASCAAPAPPPAPQAAASPQVDWSRAERVDVTLADFSFTPSRLHLRAGQPYRLHLENKGGGHNFRAPGFFAASALRTPVADGTVELASGETKELEIVPLRAGTYPLECSHLLHPLFGMTGDIVVE
jgi:uncharacterized cupredoxin-like copper-binding protein